MAATALATLAAALALFCIAGSAAGQLKTESLTIQQNYLGDPAIFNASEPDAFVRFLVIGDFGRQRSADSLGLPQCSVAQFGGNQEGEGAAQQRETAFLMNEICRKLGNCKFIVNTGDNFYSCGVYPGNYTRFITDWYNVYKIKALTPYIANLKWYNTWGNHDAVINGSIATQIEFSRKCNDWVMPGRSFTQDFKGAGIKIRSIFFDSFSFVTKYNKASSQYHRDDYVSHHNATYVNSVTGGVKAALASSTATYNMLVSHFPLFGTNTQYGKLGESAFPGEFNGFGQIVDLISTYKPTAYFNGHDHTMTLGNCTYECNDYTTFSTSGAGSWGQTGDSCGSPDSYLYTNGGNGGFIVVTASKDEFRQDFYTLGSDFPQCTVISYPDKTRPPTIGDNCAEGQPNSCCLYSGSNPAATCYKK